jgi:hypothetical protein
VIGRQNVLMWTLTGMALAVSSPAIAQIRPYEILSDEWLAGQDTDDAIAASERHGEKDTKERADLIVAVHEWYQCAQNYDEVTRGGNKDVITWDKTNIAVLSCVEQRSKVRQLAKVYSAVNGTPSMAEQKSGSIEVSLRELLTKRLFEHNRWEANR